MTLCANGFSETFVVTGQTVIQIHPRLTGMAAAVEPIRPTGAVVIARQHHLLSMTILARLLILVATEALVAFGFGRQAVRIDIVQRVNLTVEIVLLMALQALLLGMTHPAVLIIDV